MMPVESRAKTLSASNVVILSSLAFLWMGKRHYLKILNWISRWGVVSEFREHMDANRKFKKEMVDQENS